MKRNPIVFLSICLLTVLLYSCQKDLVIKGHGQVDGFVTDQNNNPIKVGITIDNNATTDSSTISGYYSVTGLSSGKHYISFSKKSYATFGQTITVTNGSTETSSTKTISTDTSLAQNIRLSALSGKVRGFVLGKGDEPVPNAKVIVYYDGFYPMADSTTSGNNGAFSFSALPLKSNVSFVAYDSTRTAAGSMSWYVDEASAENAKELGSISVSNSALSLVSYTGQGSMEGNTDAMVDTSATAITLTFSDNISQGLTDLKDGYIKLCGVDKNPTIVYSGNKITISTTGSLRANRTYYIKYKVYASDIKSSSNSALYFRTKPKATVNSNAAVISIISDTDTKSLHLVTPCSQTSNYTIYYKTATSSAYLIHSVWDGSDLNLNQYFSSGTSIYVVPNQSGSVLVNAPASNIVTFTR